MCGSCWAMATADVFATQRAIDGNDLVTLSPQHMVNCGQEYDVMMRGCGGALKMSSPARFLEYKGIPTDAEEPYTGSVGSC